MSLSGWMSDHEYEWRTRLTPVKLVVETDFSEHEVREAQKRYGAAARHLLARGETHDGFLRTYPALTLLVLVGHASLDYDQGRYWESFWEELGCGQDQDFENAIRRNLTKFLDKFSLARFPDIEKAAAYRYVMMLALHAGIPVHCLRDLLKLISDHIAQGRPARGAALVEWLHEPGKEHRAAELDVPVRNFLVNGAEFAIDILDRIIEFVEAATADPTLFDLHLDASTTGLPSVLLRELIEQLREEPLRFERKRLTGRNSSQPAIIYSVDDDEIVLILPTSEVDNDLPWRVSFDGDVRDVHPARKWGGDAQTVRVAIPSPVRETVFSHPGHGSSALPVVIKADPMMTFDRAGRWIARNDGLKDAAWAVYPDLYELVDPQSSRPLEVSDVGMPAGWHGWRSAFVELDDVTALQLRAADGTTVGTERWVRKDARPSFVLGEPLVGVYSTDGRTVYGSRPWVLLPSAQTDPGPSWNVRVRPLGHSEWLINENWDAEDEETYLDPFDDAEEAQLGLFEIIVSGPLGADARCVVFLAEGVEASFSTTVRVPDGGGLTPCAAEIVAQGFSITPQSTFEFDPRRLEAKFTLRADDVSTELVVRPPYIEVRTGEVGSPAAWRMTAAVCDPEDFAEDRFAAVRAPGVTAATMSYVSASGSLLQIDENPRRRPGDVFECRTQQFADTARANPGGRLVATLLATDGPVEATMLLAQPRQLASGVVLDEDRLLFSDAAQISDLASYVWSSTAPWAAPHVLPVVDGVATLPEELIEAGELRCQLFVDDPWVTIEVPMFPPEAAFRVDQLGWREDGTDLQVQLSRYLGTMRSAPKNVGSAPEVWAALARLHADDRMDRFHGLIEVLIDDPRRALERLGDSMIPASDKMAMLIRSEIINSNFSSEDTANDLHNHPWFGCMVELADLPSLHNRRAEVPEERAETLSYLRDRGGNPLMDLLSTGKSTSAHGACFDKNVMTMVSVPRGQIESKLREVHSVPLAQLHPDNLRAAVYEAFLQRTRWMESGWSTNYAQQLSLLLTPIRRAAQPAYEVLMNRREHVKDIDVQENPWVLMSVESLTLAFLARLEAHGRITGQYLNRGLLGNWATMAHLCPTMVANDLLIAEALILHMRRGDLTGEDS